MYTRKFAVVGVTIGLIGIVAALFTSTRTDTSEASAAEIDTEAGVLLDESTGIAPIEDVVRFFEQRVADRPSDYVSSTRLAAAISTQARQTADLALYERAEQAARTALAVKPDHVGARLELAGALHSQHRFSEARDLGQEVLNEDPASLDALYTVADANFELGRYRLAEDAFRRLEANERNAAVVSRLARLAWVHGDNERAADLAAEASELSGAFSLRPNGKAFYPFQLGHFRFEAGDVVGAVDALDAALEIDPNHAGAIEKLAFIQAAAGNHTEAMELYESLIASGPAADLHGSYADLLRAAGDAAAADEQDALGLALAEQTLDDFPAERRHLAGFYFSRDPKIALQLAEADIEERRDAGGYDTLAWALHLNGRHEPAAVAIDKALEIGTNSASIRYHAGAIAAALGDDEAALEHLDAALEINPLFAFGDAADATALRDELAGRHK